MHSSIIFTAVSSSAFVTVRGGHILNTFSPALTKSNPLSIAALTKFLTGPSNSTPIKSPPGVRISLMREVLMFCNIFTKYSTKNNQILHTHFLTVFNFHRHTNLLFHELQLGKTLERYGQMCVLQLLSQEGFLQNCCLLPTWGDADHTCESATMITRVDN